MSSKMSKKRSNLKGLRAIVLTVSDSCAAGLRQDESGALLSRLLKKKGARVVRQEIVGDERVLIKKKLIGYGKNGLIDLVLTSGGTGFGPRDVTPEATVAVIEREARGLSELIRQEGMKKTKTAVLSRGVAGLKGTTLIINLPGSPKGARESFEAIEALIPHAMAMIRGEGH